MMKTFDKKNKNLSNFVSCKKEDNRLENPIKISPQKCKFNIFRK